MLVTDIIHEANELADEQESPRLVLGFMNSAISKINIECDSIFPSLTLEDDADLLFPEKWQLGLLIPFCVGRIKQRDSSQFEYTDAYQEFMDNLKDFKSKYNIPEEFLDPDSATGGMVESDIYKKPPYPWFRW